MRSKFKKKHRLKNIKMAGASTVGGGRGGAMMGRDKETRKRRDKKKELNKVLFPKIQELHLNSRDQRRKIWTAFCESDSNIST